MLRATMPRAFRIGSDGSMTVNTDYFTNVELTSDRARRSSPTPSTPRRCGPTARRSPGRTSPSQINATSGKDKDFRDRQHPTARTASRSVTRGVDDRQAVVTFAKPFSDWRGMFAGNTMLLPKSMTANPEVFNKGQLDRPGPSAGPFIVTDAGSHRATNHVDAQPEMVGHPAAAGHASPIWCSTTRRASRHCRTTPSTPPASRRSTS